MSSKPASHRIFSVFVLLAALVLASLPAHARPLHPAVEKASHVAGFGERLWNFLVSLWPRDLRKEGMSIDPNGNH